MLDPKPSEVFDRRRMAEKGLAEMLGYSHFTMRIDRGPKGTTTLDRYSLWARPPRPVNGSWDAVEVPRFLSHPKAAEELGAMFGLELKHRKVGWHARHAYSYHANPYLDHYSGEGHLSPESAVIHSLYKQLSAALKLIEPLVKP